MLCKCKALNGNYFTWTRFYLKVGRIFFAMP